MLSYEWFDNNTGTTNPVSTFKDFPQGVADQCNINPHSHNTLSAYLLKFMYEQNIHAFGKA